MQHKKYVIPIFVPHLGCPNDCVFCNQKSISGQMKMITKEEVINTVETYLKSFKDKEAKIEIAFFGGSFTGIDVNLQNDLLSVASKYVESGKVESIRISTRPDYINKEILKRLKTYHVKTIELCVQTSNDYILNSLLTLLPKKIYIHLVDGYTDQFINTLKLVFENKVHLCTDCNICQLYKNSAKNLDIKKIPHSELS